MWPPAGHAARGVPNPESLVQTVPRRRFPSHHHHPTSRHILPAVSTPPLRMLPSNAINGPYVSSHPLLASANKNNRFRFSNINADDRECERKQDAAQGHQVSNNRPPGCLQPS